LCIGCGICVKVRENEKIKEISSYEMNWWILFLFFAEKKCPFEAISIINLPSNLEKDTTHRYGPNSFKLHRLPTPRPGQILGLVGTNGIGKSTALSILAGKLKPNLGRFNVTN
jgi:ATP-binding cassette subfamily E protein 1